MHIGMTRITGKLLLKGVAGIGEKSPPLPVDRNPSGAAKVNSTNGLQTFSVNYRYPVFKLFGHIQKLTIR